MEKSENKNTDDTNKSIAELKKITNLEFIFVILTLLIVTFFIIKSKNNTKLLELTKNKFFILFNILLIFSLYYILIVLDNKYIKLKNAIKQSFVAYIIALYAYFDLLIAPFILVFIISYFFHIEV